MIKTDNEILEKTALEDDITDLIIKCDDVLVCVKKFILKENNI